MTVLLAGRIANLSVKQLVTQALKAVQAVRRAKARAKQERRVRLPAKRHRNVANRPSLVQPGLLVLLQTLLLLLLPTGEVIHILVGLCVMQAIILSLELQVIQQQHLRPTLDWLLVQHILFICRILAVRLVKVTMIAIVLQLTKFLASLHGLGMLQMALLLLYKLIPPILQ